MTSLALKGFAFSVQCSFALSPNWNRQLCTLLNLCAKFSKCKFVGPIFLYPYPKFKLLKRRVLHITEGNIEMCSSRKYPYSTPRAPRRATELPRGEGVQKEAISEGVEEGLPTEEVFSRGSKLLIITASLLSKLSVIYRYRCFNISTVEPR